MNKQAKGGEDAIMDVRRQIHTLQEDTAIALKKNVYKNYSQFIETSKEISSILKAQNICEENLCLDNVQYHHHCHPGCHKKFSAAVHTNMI